MIFLITRSALGVMAIIVTLGRKSVVLIVMFSLCQLLHFLHDFVFVRLLCKLSCVTILLAFALQELLTEGGKGNVNGTVVDTVAIQLTWPRFVTGTLFVIVHFDACYVAFARTLHCKTPSMAHRVIAVILINSVQFASIWYTRYYFKVSFFASTVFSILMLGAFVEALHDSVQNAIMATHTMLGINVNQSYVVLIVVFASIVILLHSYTIIALGIICITSALLMVLLGCISTYRLCT